MDSLITMVVEALGYEYKFSSFGLEHSVNLEQQHPKKNKRRVIYVYC